MLVLRSIAFFLYFTTVVEFLAWCGQQNSDVSWLLRSLEGTVRNKWIIKPLRKNGGHLRLLELKALEIFETDKLAYTTLNVKFRIQLARISETRNNWNRYFKQDSAFGLINYDRNLIKLSSYNLIVK